MEVTKENFNELLPCIKQTIEESDFIAIDTELTGLYSSQSDEHAFDTMEERFMKLREQCSNFLIIQFGLSAFKYHPEEKKYTHKDFNFYVFPNPHIKQAPDPTFLCQTSSLHFLASHNFDFNKVIYEGVPYLPLSRAEELQTYLTKKHEIERTLISNKTAKILNGAKSVDIPDEHKEFISGIQKSFDSFMSDDTETTLKLEPCSPYHRKLIYETFQAKYANKILMTTETNADKQRYICILKCSEKDKTDRILAKELKDLGDLDAAVGFCKVMSHLSESKKLVIGHCMNLDIMHMIEQFFFPLPKDLREYKSMVRMLFPQLLDTKLMANSEKLKPFLESTALGDLVKQIQGNAFGIPTIETEPEFGYELNSDKYHTAGFDAFIAGVCFIGMSKKIGALKSSSITHVDTSSKHLSPFINRFFILRHYDIRSLNLSGPDPEPIRDNVFHVSFPQEWKTCDLVELFLQYGNIYVYWLNDTSALVALKEPKHTLAAKAGLLNKPSRIFQVVPYAEYQKWTLDHYNSKAGECIRSSLPLAEFKSGNKRRNSAVGTGSCNMELIPEVDENEAETTDATELQPPAKKLKPVDEHEAEEVSSTALVFEEDNAW